MHRMANRWFAWLVIALLADTAGAGAMLPPGFLHVAGNQVVSAGGQNVRLACIGYDEPTGNYPSDMAKIRKAGFNCVRQSWFDATTCPGGACDFTVMDQVVAAATAANIRVIWNHHGNEGVDGTQGNADCRSQQENGLWYDVNSDALIGGVAWNALTGNFDGCGTAGTVTYATFKANTVALARHFAANPTVIGFDLWNEPVVGGDNCGTGCQATTLNWGGVNGADLQRMYADTGSAVEAADPGALIICEGAINFTGQYLSGAYFASNTLGIGDLTGVAADPVVVGAPEVLYSVHDYPGWLSGQSPDSGPASVAFRNTAWGYLVIGNRAPVWIGEGGASLDSTDGHQADDQAWASSLMQYVNGLASGGPIFTGNQQPIGFDWWYFGDGEGQPIDGIYANAALSEYRPGQRNVWRTLQYKRTAAAQE